MSKVHSFKLFQLLPVDLDTAWTFFSEPANLKKITPETMGFDIISKYHGDKMYAGQVIEYKVKPILGIPLYWMTEITHVDERKYFVDEQRYGPYKMWHHQHHFREVAGGVEMIDIVHYKMPMGFLGDLAQSLFVRKQLKEIFEYRYKAAEQVFGKFSDQFAAVEEHKKREG